MLREFRSRRTRDQNSRNPSWSKTRRKKRRFHSPDLSSPSLCSFEKRGENISHGISVDGILATLHFFSVSPCL